MRAVWVGFILALAACDQVFGLEGRTPDAFVPAPGCWDRSFTGNEDTDTVVDGCDNCPLTTNELQLDTDRDGVGDDCDPNPNDAIEEIAVFEPMPIYTSTAWSQHGQLSNWQTGPGGRDVKQLNRGDGQNMTSALVYLTQPVDQPMIQLKVTTTNPDADPDLSVVGAYLILDTTVMDSTPDGVICGMHYASDQADVVEGWSRVQSLNVANTPATAPLGGEQPSVITITTNEAGKSATDPVTPMCTIRRGDTFVSAPVGMATIAPSGARFGMWTNNVSATFSALFVTRRRPGT